ncbi:unnamed protein product [Blepharisma stoltei]|uniref:Uncharacterized protein n=1 Tax=Blepharisma stoltei TaxID=1481888 RepID=A0AAU9JLD5_9CILI|nr:unnamed protein product [Blepharisma stoltei]
METFSCSFDSFDAIYACACKKYFCSKHYFSHKQEFPDHSIERIKIPTSKESKEILIEYILFIKQILDKCFEKWIEELSTQETPNYDLESLQFFNKIICACDRFLKILMTKKYVSMKLIFNPLEYFLIQPQTKALKYVEELQIPLKNDYDQFVSEAIIISWHLFDFNYLIRKQKIH